MKIFRPQAVIPKRELPTPSLVVDDSAANAEATKAEAERILACHRNCARLATEVYSEKLAQQQTADPKAGLFVDTDLDLRGIGRVIDGEAYVAFRGTVGCMLMSTNWRKVNLRSTMIGEPPRHAGFTAAWRALEKQVDEWLDTCPGLKVHLTGHSMGAAVAQMAALELSRNRPVQWVVLFATPMIGSENFNQLLNHTSVVATGKQLAVQTQRYLMLTDAISFPLPRLVGYSPIDPICRIDVMGAKAQYFPDFFMQTLGSLVNKKNEPQGFFVVRPWGKSAEADMGAPDFVDRVLPALAPIGLSLSPWTRGLILIAAFAGACARALGFHSMNGYARALRVSPIPEQKSYPNAFVIALIYFGIVFGVGFLLGSVRVPFVVPQLGARAAELLEMPFMLAAIILAASYLVEKHRDSVCRPCWAFVGLLSLAFMIAAEVLVVVFVAGNSLSEYIYGRDPVSGSVYVVMLLVFAAMPLFRSGRASS